MTTDQRPSAEDLEQAHQTVRTHQPDPHGTYLRKCMACADSWPCREYQDSIKTQTAAYGWIWDAVATLPDRYSERVPAHELAPVREYVNVGEWAEALELLMAVLSHLRVAVTGEERAELDALAEAMDLSARVGETGCCCCAESRSI